MESGLTGGAARISVYMLVGQVVGMAAAPILTRLFPAEEFGQMAVLQACGAFLLYAAAGRYDVAILVPKSDEEAADVFTVALFTVGLSSAIFAASYFVTGAWSFFHGSFQFVGYYGWVVILTQFTGGVQLCFSNFAIRKNAIPGLARSKVYGPVGSVFAQIGLGSFGLHPVGLFLGEPVGLLCRVFPLIASAAEPRCNIWTSSATRIRGAFRRYSDYPRWGLPGILISSFSRYSLPPLLVSLYDAQIAGYYALTMRVVSSPVELIGRGFTEVFLGKASGLMHLDKRALERLYVRSAAVLMLVGIGPALAVFFVGPQAFSLVFGAEWRPAGIVASRMAIMLPFAFVNYPMVHMLNVLRRPFLQLCWDFATLIVGPCGVAVARSLFEVSFVGALTYYAMAMSAMFTVHFFLTLYVLKRG